MSEKIAYIDTARVFMLYAATAVACGLLFVNIYTSMVDAVSWGSNIPASIEVARHYFASGNPGKFFRLFSPLNQIFALLALVFCWKVNKKIRICCILALVAAVSIDAFTFVYFYPRNDVMFVNPIGGNIDAVRSAWSSWSTMNWVRSGLIFINGALHFTVITLLLKHGQDTIEKSKVF